jgi:amino acid adenylation domain-containing protein
MNARVTPTNPYVEFEKQEVEQSIAQRFEKIVEAYPDRVAVKTRNCSITYGSLNNMANRVARAIMTQRGSDAEPVGLLFANGVPLVAAMVGVLKAGKFFVYLDSSSPKARVAGVLEDCQPGLIVTDQQHFSVASELAGHGNEVLNMDTLNPQLSHENVALSLTPGSLSAIIYTSGSTGKPKGVIQNHLNMLHYTRVRTNALHICEQDRMSLLSSGTAGAMFITFAALLNGAALLPFDLHEEGVTGIANWLRQEEITICYIGSPLFRNLGEILTGKETFPKLRLIRLASEASRASDVEIYRKYFSPNCILVNGLSSTETGILSKYFVDRKTQITGSQVPVGYAVEDKEIVLLDDSGRELGFNEVGEIAVRSRYLASGYWQRPELTRVKFRPDPADNEKRLYLTGDLGLMLPDGCLIHKGRKDFRVKIRGYGVEVAEVETAILAHDSIREAVVVARQNESGEDQLVAYCTSCSPPANTAELRSFLRQKLPEYMIPSAFVILDAIPRTVAGKLDRRGLPDPGNSRPDLDTPYAAPRTPAEIEVEHLWREVLSLDRIGVHDNFFDLGGHSLAATRVVSQVIKKFQLEIPLQSLFRSPTIAQMAEVIAQSQANKIDAADLNRMLAELESLTDEQAQQIITQDTRVDAESKKK